jgi:hypothetical protein
VTLIDATAAKTSFTPAVAGAYAFTLTVEGAGGAQTVALSAIHNQVSLGGKLEIPMESFTRAVEIVLKESALQDRPVYRPSVDMWKHAVRNCGYVQARAATARILTELPLLT